MGTTQRFNVIYNDDVGGIFTHDMKGKVNDSLDKWNKIITSMPGSDETRKIEMTFVFKNQSNGVLASAGPRSVSSNFQNEYFNYYSLSGQITFNNDYYDTWSDPNNSLFENTIKHEMGHVLGIGTFWDEINSPNNSNPNLPALAKSNLLLENQIDSTGNDHTLYTGLGALNAYQYYNAGNVTYKVDGVDSNYTNNDYPSVIQTQGVPVENNGGEGTAGGHPEEGLATFSLGEISRNNIIIDGVFYPGLGDELMTGQAEQDGVEMPLSAITVGFVQDLGYGVDYSFADAYALGTGAGDPPEGFDEFPCFIAGSLVETDQGIIPIEKLKPFINTIDGKKIQKITKSVSLNKDKKDYLILFKKDCFCLDMPNKDTICSPNHKIYENGEAHIAKWYFKQIDGIEKIPYKNETLYNVLLNTYTTMKVNGMKVETLHIRNKWAKK